jgi:two-component system NarL family sensor kinase
MEQNQLERVRKSRTFVLLLVGVTIVVILNIILAAIQSVLQQNQDLLTQIAQISNRVDFNPEESYQPGLNQLTSIQHVMNLFQTSQYLNRAKLLVPEIQRGFNELAQIQNSFRLDQSVPNNLEGIQLGLDSVLRGLLFVSNQGNLALGTLSGLISLFAILILGTLIILTGWFEVELIERNWDKRTATQIVEREETLRQMIASELHDDIAQTLALAKIKASAEVGELIGQSINSIRNLTRNLSLPKLDSNHLVLALEELIQQYRSTSDFRLQFTISGSLSSLDDQIQAIHVYRIVQELLQNALKHSSAQNVSLTIHRGSDLLSIRYRDDGKGMKLQQLETQNRTKLSSNLSPTNQLGLKNIQDRIKLMQGTISITSKESRGVMIDLDIPVT